MTIEIREHRPGEDITDFIRAGHVVFEGDPAWVPPLDFEIKERLHPKKNPFFEAAPTGDDAWSCRCCDRPMIHRSAFGHEIGLPMPATLTVRPATRADIPLQVDFNAAMAWETEGKRLDPERLARGIAGPFEQPGRGRYFVAEREGAVVGSLLVTYEWSHRRDGDWWWIQSVYVAEAARRQGVFRALYAELEREARATPGVVGLRLSVEREHQRAQGTYLAPGMEQCHYRMYERAFIELAQG